MALSGGVDSSVAAYLLKEQGHELTGVYVRTWENENDPLGECPGARISLMPGKWLHALASFEILNLIDFYNKQVVEPMVQGYAGGITPNPDILCNRKMKFGELMSYAIQGGFEALATGHYCRRIVGGKGKAELWEGLTEQRPILFFGSNNKRATRVRQVSR